MSETLYDLSADIEQVQRVIEDAGLEPTDDEWQAVRDAALAYLEERKTALDAKLDNYAYLIALYEDRARVAKQEADRLVQRARVNQNRAERMKEALKTWMLTHGHRSVETSLRRITVADNGGKVPVILTVPPELLPTAFTTVKTQVQADLDAIREELLAGRPVPGASLGTRGTHLLIK